MKAVYVSHSPVDSAGAELALIELAEGIIETASMDLHVVVPAEGPLFRRLTSIGVPTSVIPHLTWTDRPLGAGVGSWIRYAAQRGRSVCRVIALVRRLRCDVVVSNTSTVFTPAIAAKITGVAHVWYVHEFGVKDHNLRYDLGFERSMSLIGKLSRMVLVPSRVVSSGLEEWVDPAKIRVIPCAVHGPSHLAQRVDDDSAWRLVLVGRKSPGKGQTDAVDAVAALHRMGHPVRLRLVGGGDGPYVQSLCERARRLGVDQYVDFVDATPQVIDHYRWAQIVLVCSSAEAFGRVTVEAMKYGRPVVGARAAGTAELIRDGETGVLYRPGDAHDLASKVVDLMSNPEGMAGIAHRAQEWAEKSFSLPAYVATFTSILHEAVGVRALVGDGRSARGKEPVSNCRQRLSPGEGQIAVIVPTFQPGPYLGETLASIERQTRPPEEVVVVDDGSEPPVQLPASRMPIRVLRVPHGGIAAARNAGVLATTAPLVHICDHDDILEPSFYESQIAAFTDAFPPDIAYSVCGFIDKDGAVLPGRLPWNEPPGGSRTGVLRALLHGNEIASVAAVFRRATFDDLGGFRSLDYVQDWDFWIRAAAQGFRFQPISDTLAWHRVHPAQQSSEARRVLALEESLMTLSSAGLPARVWLTARRARGGLHLQLSRLLRARGEPGVTQHALQGFAGRPLLTCRAILGALR